MIQNKHIIRFSFIGLFLNILANIVLYRYFIIEEVVLKQAADQNLHIAETYKNRVWDENRIATLKLQQNDYNNLLQDKDFINLIQASSNFLKTIDAETELYDHSGNRVLVNNDNGIINIDNNSSSEYYTKFLLYLDKYFLKNYIKEHPLTESFRGKTSHALVSRATVTDASNNVYEKSYVSSYIPIIESSMGGFNIVGLIKITTDITEQWENIMYLEQRIFAAFVIVFFVFFVIVMYNTNYAQRIINQQFETNRQLEEAKTKAETDSSAKTDFLANVSHELRTPLNAIIGFSDILLAETHGKINNEKYKGYISDINGSGKHLLSVINDILDFSKASVDKLKIEKVYLDLNKLAASSMRFVKPRADAANIQLIEKMPKEHIVINADPKRLKQALLNLLSNSVKFTPSDGSVTLTLKKNTLKKIVYIIVADTGIGMSDKDIPKALSSFGQVDNKLSRKYEGTGLGLPLTKKLVELMGGVFDLKSTPGQGTTITISFKYNESVS
jgi:two-component system, cell cycle sensor histidine kinase PleC